MKILPISFFSSRISNFSLSLLKDAKSLLSKGLRFAWFLYNIRIEGEAPAETKNSENVQNLTVNWPARGAIEFKNYFVKYRPNLPHVIDDLSVSINASEKVPFFMRIYV